MVKSIYKLQNSQPRYELKTETKKGKVLWFTGLSGAGKSTLAELLKNKLIKEGLNCKILDGDILRTGLNNNLGFSEKERFENIRRTAEVAKLFSESGFVVIVAFITPTQSMRNLAKNIIGAENFYEIFIDASLEVCEKRDVKGLYKKARNGEIQNFTGISACYECPQNPDLIVPTYNLSVSQSSCIILNLLKTEIPALSCH